MFTTDKFMTDYLSGIQECINRVPIEKLSKVAERIRDAYRRDRLVAIVGNGGSAATASHLAADLGKNIFAPGMPEERCRFRVMALTDNVPMITALGNDVGYDSVFTEQLRNWVRPGDLVIAMSVSGNSPNVCRAVKMASEMGAYTIAFLGADGGALKGMVDLAVHIPSPNYGYVEDMHMMFSHMVTAFVRRTLAEEWALDANSMRRQVSNSLKAVVLAAGEGSRLRPLTLEQPKPMLPINGRPLLETTVAWLGASGVETIAINLHHHPEVVVAHLRDGARWGVKVSYSYEDKLLGTAGAIRKLHDSLCDGPFAVVYGDVLTDLDLQALFAYHRLAVAQDPSVGLTMSLYHVADPLEAGLVELDVRGRVTRFVEKPKASEIFTDLANAGVLIAEPSIIDHIPPDTFFDFGHDLFPALLRAGVTMQGWVIPENSFLLDIGTPERYARAQVEWAAHLAAEASLAQPAVLQR